MTRGERFRAVQGDLVAGVTGGIVAVPQGIAFALIAHVPPEHGLFAMIVPTAVAALVRDSPYLITGATNTSALVIGALIASLGVPGVDAVRTMLLITLLMGAIQVAAGALRLGDAARYVSQAVLVGFTLGVATLIVIGQLRTVLGLELGSSFRVVEDLWNVARDIGAVDPRAVTIAAVTWVVLAVCQRISRLIPGAMLAVVVTAAMVALLGWNSSDPVRLVGEIPRTLPSFTVPDLSVGRMEQVMAPSLAIAILGMVEAISIGEAVSSQAGVRFQPNRELVAKGAGNVAGAFLGCMPTSASWTRSAINLQLGARTRWVGVIAAATVIVIMLLLGAWASIVPTACLGALILWIGVHMVDLTTARYVWRWSREDAAVLVVTYVSTLLFPIQYAIYFGVVASLALLVRRQGNLRMAEIVAAGPQTFREIEIDAETGARPITLLQLEGDLFFGITDELEERLWAIARNGTRAIIIRLKRAHAIDATAAESLADFARRYRRDGGRLILCGLKPDLFARIARSHLGEVLGAENLLATDPVVFGSMRTAIESVRRALGPSADGSPIRTVTPASRHPASYSI